ncbi:plexin B-like protein 1 [Sarcoptes scabiei]|uniref:Plexin B-like protein 1 n=1 Tax=Sarcoptes scabiei TaxID=52283 RepID=A0A132A2Q5_SARSC|nr:plexin B-like protein 1 [Sarcoptes scabiei]
MKYDGHHRRHGRSSSSIRSNDFQYRRRDISQTGSIPVVNDPAEISMDSSIFNDDSSLNSVNEQNKNKRSPILKTYSTSNKNINFTHIEFDPITGNVYVGASNWIFQLESRSLRVEHAVRTGPIRDSPVCPPSDCTGVDLNFVQITNNINKILLVEPYARMLVVCGSVHQGGCTRHRLDDISQHEDLVPLPVAANDENSSTIAFVGPARYFGVQLTPILYVAATDTRLGPYRDMVPSIAGRSLESSRLFTIIDRGFADSARVDISSNIRDYFLVHYVYGFYANDYVYFAQVQRKSYLRTMEELAGTDLTESLRLESGSLVLIGVFTNSRQDHTNKPGGRSAVCVFPIAQIEQSFTENIHLCYNGSVFSRNMDYIAGSVNQCPEPGVGGFFFSYLFFFFFGFPITYCWYL